MQPDDLSCEFNIFNICGYIDVSQNPERWIQSFYFVNVVDGKYQPSYFNQQQMCDRGPSTYALVQNAFIIRGIMNFNFLL